MAKLVLHESFPNSRSSLSPAFLSSPSFPYIFLDMKLSGEAASAREGRLPRTRREKGPIHIYIQMHTDRAEEMRWVKLQWCRLWRWPVRQSWRAAASDGTVQARRSECEDSKREFPGRRSASQQRRISKSKKMAGHVKLICCKQDTSSQRHCTKIISKNTIFFYRGRLWMLARDSPTSVCRHGGVRGKINANGRHLLCELCRPRARTRSGLVSVTKTISKRTLDTIVIARGPHLI